MSFLVIDLSGGHYALDDTSQAEPRLLPPGVQPTAFAIDPSEPKRIYWSTYRRVPW